MDIASLGVRIESIGAEKGTDALEQFAVTSEKAETAQEALEKQSRDTSKALTDAGKSAADATKGLSAMQVTTQELAKAEEVAQARIKDVVRRSLDKQQAMLAAASATRSAAQASDEAARAFAKVRPDQLGDSFAAAQAELDAFSEAMANQAQSLEDIGERQAWLTDLFERGQISVEDYEQAGKKLEKQERDLTRAQADHAREVAALVRHYDPASAALKKITADERALEQAWRSGAITAQQYQKAIAGLTVNRARWQAEAAGIKETAHQIDKLSFVSAAAFRDYGTFATAIGTGQFGLASRQILQLGIRTNALRAALTPLGVAAGAAAAVVGVLATASFKAQKESYELAKAITFSGNAAGVNAGRIAEMAEGVDAIVGTRGSAVETLTALASAGRVAAADLQEFTVVTQLLARNVGQEVKDTVEIFASLKKEPVEASLRLNEQLNYLTDAMKDQIIQAQVLGDIENAGALAQRFYAAEAERRARQVGETLPDLQKGAKATAGAFKEMWDLITGQFVKETPEDRLAELRAKRGGRALGGGRTIFDDADDAQERALAATVEERDRKAAGEALKAREGRAKDIARRELAQRLAAERQIADAVSGARGAGIQRELNNSVAQYAAYESQLEALRSAGLVSEEIYYSEKRKLIEQNRDAQIEALQSENRRVAADNERIRKQAEIESGNATTEPEKLRIEAAAQAIIIANQAKIADGESRIAILRGEAIADLNVLETQQKAANKAIQDSYDDATEAAERHLSVIKEQQRLELEGFGQGARQRDINRSRSDINSRFEDQRQDLEGDRRNKRITSDEYDRHLAIINEFNRQALAASDDYYSALADKQASWLIGAQEAFANFRDDAANVAGQTEGVYRNLFDGMTDELVQFARTGKIDFRSLAESIIADLLRIQIQAALVGIFGNIAGAFAGGAFGGVGAGGGTVPTSGGPMFADTGIKRVPRDNQPAILHKDEAVIPADMNPYAGGSWGSRPPVDITMNLYPAPGTDNAQFHAMLAQAKGEIMREVFESFHRERFG